MSFLAIPIVSKIIEELLSRIPDPNERAKERARLEAELLTAEREARQGQLEINKVEAAHRSIFVAGWRPFIGWVGGSALAWMYVLKPIFTYILLLNGYATPLPDLVEAENMLELIAILLGVGGMRTFEKVKGVNHK